MSNGRRPTEADQTLENVARGLARVKPNRITKTRLAALESIETTLAELREELSDQRGRAAAATTDWACERKGARPIGTKSQPGQARSVSVADAERHHQPRGATPDEMEEDQTT
jgi:hypothetical protein